MAGDVAVGPRFIAEGSFANVPFANNTGWAKHQFRASSDGRLRTLSIGVRGGGGGAAVPGVCRVIGYIGEASSADVTAQTNLSDDVPGVQGRKFCDAMIATADLAGLQTIWLNHRIAVNETATVLVSPILGNVGGALSAPFLCSCTLAGADMEEIGSSYSR